MLLGVIATCLRYGMTSHIYNCYDFFCHWRNYHLMEASPVIDIFYLSGDTFEENTPPSSDPNYISSLGAATSRGMMKM
jgi:hypothetical protein